jgi:hypothetical protein
VALQVRNTTEAGIAPRLETLHGVEHIVVPAVMMVEGVHNGSSGAGYYSPEVMREVDVAWNNKPATYNHPDTLVDNATTLEQHQLGILLNTQTGEDGRQKTEVWFNKTLLQNKDEALYARVMAGEQIEVSTGYVVEALMTPGTWNSEEYAWSATRLVPDHFAILPSTTGACSVADGAGLCRNQASEKTTQPVDNSISVPDDESLTELIDAVRNAVYSTFPDNHETGDYVYCLDIFPKSAIYRRAGQLHAVNWSKQDGRGIVIDTASDKIVTRKVSYNQAENMNKAALIAAILAKNSALGANSQELGSLSEAALQNILTGLNAAAPAVATPEAKPTVVDNAADLPKVVSPALLATINAAFAAGNALRADLIAKVKSLNSQVPDAVLNSLSNEQLDAFAKAAPAPAAPASAPYLGLGFPQVGGYFQAANVSAPAAPAIPQGIDMSVGNFLPAAK